jgi:uncharacterized membrane protein
MMPNMTESAAAVASPDRVVRLTRALSIASLLGLIVLGLVWELFLAPTGNRTLVLKVVPLLFPLIGLLKHRMYTHRWVSLLVWIYFTEGVVRATSDTGISQGLATVEVLLSLLLFTASAWHVRWRLAQARSSGS